MVDSTTTSSLNACGTSSTGTCDWAARQHIGLRTSSRVSYSTFKNRHHLLYSPSTLWVHTIIIKCWVINRPVINTQQNLTVVVWWSYSSSRCSLGLSMSGVFCRRSWWVCRGTWPMPFPTTDDRREIFRLISTNSSMPSKAYRANWGPPDHTLSRLGELTHLVNQFIN